MEREYIIDDSPVVIPDYIRKMSKEELAAEIEKLETEARRQKEGMQQKKDLTIV